MRIPIARYGLGTLTILSIPLLGAAAACFVYCRPAAPLPLVLWAGALMFFRDPERRASCGDDDLLSPADGVVADIEEGEDPGFLGSPATRIGVFMSVFNVHVNRSPAAGTVRWVSYHPGSFHDARRQESQGENEHCYVGIELPDGRRIVVNQIAGLVARRIVCAVSEGDKLERGERFGMIKFGSRLELYLPVTDEYRVAIGVGDRVKAGLTVLASREAARRAAFDV